MLDFFKAKVELVELDHKQLVFRTKRKFKEGVASRVRVEIPPGSAKTTTLDIEVTSVRSEENGEYVYVARLFAGGGSEQKISGAQLRGSVRRDISVRVMSPQLPGFRAMTLDVSSTGLRIQMDGPLEVGKTIPLTLEFDRFDLSSLSCPAEVRWCRVSDRGRYMAGFHFLPPDPETEKNLRDMGEFFEATSQFGLKELLDRSNMLAKAAEQPHEVQKAPKAIALGAHDPAAPAKPKAEEAPASSAPAAAATTAPAKPAAEAPQPTAEPASPAVVEDEKQPALPPPAVDEAFTDIPVNAKLVGYGWELEQETLVVVLRSDDDRDQELGFPDCRRATDHRCFDGLKIAALRVRLNSKLLQDTRESWDVGTRKHYQFLAAGGTLVLEVISGPCGAVR